MALCLDGTLTKPTISAKLTATELSASLSYVGLRVRLQRNNLSGSLSRKSGIEASIEEQRPFGSYELSKRLDVKAAVSHREFARAMLSGTTHSATLVAKIGATATLNANRFLNASMKRKGVDGYFTLFCPIDYLKACFSNGWNNDAPWDNDAGWNND